MPYTAVVHVTPGLIENDSFSETFESEDEVIEFADTINTRGFLNYEDDGTQSVFYGAKDVVKVVITPGLPIHK